MKIRAKEIIMALVLIGAACLLVAAIAHGHGHIPRGRGE